MRNVLPFLVLGLFVVSVFYALFGFDALVPVQEDCNDLAMKFDEQFTIPEQFEIKDPCRTQWSFNDYLDIPSFWVGGTLVRVNKFDDAGISVVLRGNQQEGELFLVIYPFALSKYKPGQFYKIDFGNYCKNKYAMVDSRMRPEHRRITSPKLISVACG